MRIARRYGIADAIERLKRRPPREWVIQDIEVPIGRTVEFLDWFLKNVPIEPIWLCPVRMRDDDGWSLYPLRPRETYVNVGFWSTVAIAPGAADGDVNRAIEGQVTDHGGHKSLYSDAYYDRETFDRLYGVANQRRVKQQTDPDNRLTGLYEKAVNRR